MQKGIQSEDLRRTDGRDQVTQQGEGHVKDIPPSLENECVRDIMESQSIWDTNSQSGTAKDDT